jgi:hypothetical protein
LTISGLFLSVLDKKSRLSRWRFRFSKNLFPKTIHKQWVVIFFKKSYSNLSIQDFSTSDLCIKINWNKMMTDKELLAWMQERFERLLARFDRIDRHLENMAVKEKILDGERLLDNQDVCQMLNVSKRTLQRYRSSGELPYQMLYHKTFYKESDVEAFIRANFAKGKDSGGDVPEDTRDDTEETQ